MLFVFSVSCQNCNSVNKRLTGMTIIFCLQQKCRDDLFIILSFSTRELEKLASQIGLIWKEVQLSLQPEQNGLLPEETNSNLGMGLPPDSGPTSLSASSGFLQAEMWCLATCAVPNLQGMCYSICAVESSALELLRSCLELFSSKRGKQIQAIYLFESCREFSVSPWKQGSHRAMGKKGLSSSVI